MAQTTIAQERMLQLKAKSSSMEAALLRQLEEVKAALQQERAARYVLLDIRCCWWLCVRVRHLGRGPQGVG